MGICPKTPEGGPHGPSPAQATRRVCIVTNIPAPYRVPVLNALAGMPGLDLSVMYCARSEPDRHWDLPPLTHAHRFLEGRVWARSGRYVHFNPSVWPALRLLAPHIVVTTGFNPTHLMAWAYTRAYRVAHVAMTDGTDHSEASLGPLHRQLRRAVFSTSRAFVVASRGGERLLQQYAVEMNRVHRSPLIANPAVDWRPESQAARDIDMLWSGRIEPVKNLEFALEVAAGTARRVGRTLHLAVLGSGSQMARMQQLAAALSGQVRVTFAGHVAQPDLPGWYARSRLFLFPTRWDPWGVVANEACEAGVPVIVSPHAGAAGELVLDHRNGRILPLEAPAWIAACAELLADEDLWQRMSKACREQAGEFGLQAAVAGLFEAFCQAGAAKPS